MSENGWLIERCHATGRAEWWAGLHGWSFDSLAAIRFSRSADAEAMILYLGGCPCAFATEHECPTNPNL